MLRRSSVYVISRGTSYPQSQRTGGKWNVLHTTRVYLPEGSGVMALLKPWPLDPAEARKFTSKSEAEAVRASFGFPEQYQIETLGPRL